MGIAFYYPTKAGAIVTVSLGDVEMLPMYRTRRKIQTAMETDAGEIIVYDWGDDVSAWPMRLYPLTTTEKTELEDFFRLSPNGGVNGQAEAFEFEDSFSTLYPVKFGMDVFEPILRRNVFWEVSVILRVIG